MSPTSQDIKLYKNNKEKKILMNKIQTESQTRLYSLRILNSDNPGTMTKQYDTTSDADVLWMNLLSICNALKVVFVKVKLQFEFFIIFSRVSIFVVYRTLAVGCFGLMTNGYVTTWCNQQRAQTIHKKL